MLVPPYLFFNDTATSELSTLSLHDALPICQRHRAPDSRHSHPTRALAHRGLSHTAHSRSRSPLILVSVTRDRKSTRLNSSHVEISYAVFCLKKKKLNSKVALKLLPAQFTQH